MSRVLGLVYRAIETHLFHRAGCTRATAKTGSVTLIQRFGSALNLNIHFHMLFVDGVYLIDRETPVLRRLPAPRPEILEALIHTISERVGAYLEREDLLVRDIENTYLQLEPPDDSVLNNLLGHSITYRIAVGPQAGRKAFTLQTVPAREPDHDQPNLAKTAGFSLHAGVAAKAHQRHKLERLRRYIARTAPHGHARAQARVRVRARKLADGANQFAHRAFESPLYVHQHPIVPTTPRPQAPFLGQVPASKFLSVRYSERYNDRRGLIQSVAKKQGCRSRPIC